MFYTPNNESFIRSATSNNIPCLLLHRQARHIVIRIMSSGFHKQRAHREVRGQRSEVREREREREEREREREDMLHSFALTM